MSLKEKFIEQYKAAGEPRLTVKNVKENFDCTEFVEEISVKKEFSEDIDYFCEYQQKSIEDFIQDTSEKIRKYAKKVNATEVRYYDNCEYDQFVFVSNYNSRKETFDEVHVKMQTWAKEYKQDKKDYERYLELKKRFS